MLLALKWRTEEARKDTKRREWVENRQNWEMFFQYDYNKL